MIHTILHWLAVHTGTVNESGPYYGFFSGFGSDIAEFGILGGLFTAYKHKNCHAPGCPRLGHPVPGTPYIACKNHNPAMLRHPTHLDIVKAHKEAQK